MTVISRFLTSAMKLPPAKSHAVKVERDLQIAMPDGAILLADRYLPANGSGPLVLVRSPYGRKAMFGALFGTIFAERGLQVLMQSCRGTFGSGGTFDPFAERDDGLATVDWMRKQDWYPGSFAMAGPSYLGIVQWAIAAKVGPELTAMAALVTSTEPYELLYGGGSFALETTLTWANLVAGQERRFALLRQGPSGKRLTPLFNELPLGELDTKAVGHSISDWQNWLSHPDLADPYWTGRRFSADRAAVTASVDLVAGWQDIFLPGQLRDYQALREAGQEPYLLIGPWQHTDIDGMGASVKEALTWLRAQLLDDRSELRTAPVRIYVGGLDEWRDLPSWPPAGTEQRWHLQADGGLATAEPVDSSPDRYTYDPANPTPSVEGPVLSAQPSRRKPPRDNRELEARSDVLTYTSPVLEADLEVIGNVSAELFVSSSVQHTDFFARLCDVDAAGHSSAVCDGLVRLTAETTAQADGVIKAAIELWPTAYRFLAGHRIRLQVSSGAHPRFARNPGTGEPLLTATKLVSADQQIYHAPAHPSAIILPVTTP
jgi:uncharacterized protein